MVSATIEEYLKLENTHLLEEEYGKRTLALFDEYSDVIANSIYNNRPSKADVKHKFDLTNDFPTFKKLHRVLQAYNEVF